MDVRSNIFYFFLTGVAFAYRRKAWKKEYAMPAWLLDLAWISLALGGVSALLIIIDELQEPQHMWIMNVVWPVTALYSSVIALWAYYRFGRLSTKRRVIEAKQHGQENPGKKKAAPAIYALATTHCGSGCTLGDILLEWSIFFFPVILTAFGFHTLWNEKMFSAWALDFIVAFTLGVAFQYFTIVPLRHLSPGKGLLEAFKADALALTAWQMGMYGWMAIAMFAIFGHELKKTSPVFWFMMQIAMLCGFVTSYPVNIWLVIKGIKEKM
jgi:hypothetical protein